MPTDKYGLTFDPNLLNPPASNSSFTPVPPLSQPSLSPYAVPTDPFAGKEFFKTDPIVAKTEEQIRAEVDQEYANKTARPKWSRQPMMWELYDGTMIEMYVNPQNVSIQASKKITYNRTKGGFMVQYWGDDLLSVTINGTTGSSGIEGIELLYDLYQSELLPPSRLDELRGIGKGSGYLSSVPGVNPGRNPNDEDELRRVRRTDLVTRATQVVLWYGSKRYYGFFTSFTIQEAASTPGEYTYSLTYVVWKTVGRDNNYMPWHRNPRPLATGNSGVPEAPGSVSIYAIQGATNADVAPKSTDPTTSQTSPPESIIQQPSPSTPPGGTTEGSGDTIIDGMIGPKRGY